MRFLRLTIEPKKAPKSMSSTAPPAAPIPIPAFAPVLSEFDGCAVADVGCATLVLLDEDSNVDLEVKVSMDILDEEETDELKVSDEVIDAREPDVNLIARRRCPFCED